MCLIDFIFWDNEEIIICITHKIAHDTDNIFLNPTMSFDTIRIPHVLKEYWKSCISWLGALQYLPFKNWLFRVLHFILMIKIMLTYLFIYTNMCNISVCIHRGRVDKINHLVSIYLFICNSIFTSWNPKDKSCPGAQSFFFQFITLVCQTVKLKLASKSIVHDRLCGFIKNKKQNRHALTISK